MIKEYKNAVDAASTFITIACTAISIYLFAVAKNVDDELKMSTQKIEYLSNRMDSAIARIEPVVNETHKLTNDLAKKTAQRAPSSLKGSSGAAASQLKKYWEKGAELMDNGRYEKAIAQYKEIAKLSAGSRSEAYFNIAIAYSKLLHGDCSERKQELYGNAMLSYLKKAAHGGSKEAQRLLQKYGESW
ncbi:MAG: hypothetical protein LBJ57_01155 [Prevotellaceae bacterium]|jgi:uncharacterized protein YoxC|nr:hypothetical protein [Prevotellaceae bacterium]